MERRKGQEAGRELLSLDQLKLAHIAQSVEHFLGKEEVTGSNPVMSSSVMVSRSGALRGGLVR